MSRIDNLNLARYTQNVKNYIDGATDAVEDRIKLLIDQPAITATFTITEADTEINLHNLTVSYIDWGDNTTNSELTHTYTSAGIYTCKIYSVTSIGSSAFRDCDSLTSVVIGDSVTSIGNRAFAYCSSLTSIEIPDSVIDIGKGAFGDCTSLTEMTIPFVGNSRDALDYKAVFGYIFGYETSESIDPIEDTTCQYWDEDSTHYHYYIPASLKKVTVTGGTIGNKAFYNCSGLTSVNIGDNVTSIGQEAFAFCSGLTSIVIPNSVKTIGALAIRNCDNLTSVEVIGSGDTSIGEGAFWYCENLTNVVIGDGVTSIGNAAFHACANLVEMTIPFVGATKNGTSNTHFGYILGAASFSEHAAITPVSLKKIVITGGTIGNSAFRECSNLTDIEISDNVTSIKADAFMGCSSLTSITISNSVTSIGDHAFDGCGSLTEIVIPDGVTEIGESAFEECANLTSVVIGNGVTIIGLYAFKDCINLTSIVIGDSVITIADAAFYNCSSLTSITIPSSVDSIGNSAFYSCDNLVDVELSDGVMYINNQAFYGCSSLTSITIPNSVTSIGDYAFRECTSLPRITIPDSVTWIGSDAFTGCTSLTEMTIPFTGDRSYGTSNTHFGHIFGATSYAYNDQYVPTSLKKVTITSTTTIYGNTFNSCSNLTEIILPESVTTIGNFAFAGCNSLISITIGNSVQRIGTHVFNGCNRLTSMVIPNSVEAIGGAAFQYCTGLTGVVIPDSVTEMGDEVFYECPSLTIYCVAESKPSDWSETWNYDERPVVWGYVPHTATAAENIYNDLYTENLHVGNNAVELGLVDSFDTVGLIKNGSNVVSVSGYTACPIVGGVPYYYGGTPDSGGGSGSGVESTQAGESETVYILGATSVNSASSPTKAALNITATGSKLTAGSFYALSDLRLKENITEFKPQNSILELPIVEFDFKKSGEHQIGCIAQDLQKICPEIVEQGSDGFLKIQESKIVYLLLDEVKKLRAELDQLKEGKN